MDAFLAGVCVKLYDDLVLDNSILTDPFATTALRTLIITFVTTMLLRDFWLCCIFIIVNTVAYLADPLAYATPHERSLLVFSPVMLVLSWSQRPPISLYDVGLLALCMVASAGESYMFPEDVSLVKWIARGLYVVGTTTVVVTLPLSASFKSWLTCGIGYFMTSSLVQMLFMTGQIPLPP